MDEPLVLLASIVGLTTAFQSAYTIKILTPLSILLALTSLQLIITQYALNENITPIFNPSSPETFANTLVFCNILFTLFSIAEIFLYKKNADRKREYSNSASILSATLSRAFTPSIMICALAIAINLPSIFAIFFYGTHRADARAEFSYVVMISLYLLIPLIIFQYSKRHPSYWRVALLSAIFFLFAIFIGFRGLLLTLGIAIVFGELLKRETSFFKKSTTISFIVAALSILILTITMLRPEARNSFEYALLNRMVFTPAAQFEIAQSLFFYQDYPGQWIIRQYEEKFFGLDNFTLGRAIYLIQHPGSSAGTGSAMIFGDFAAVFDNYLFVMVLLTCTILIVLTRAALIRLNWRGDNIPIILLQLISVRWFLFGFSAVDIYFLIFVTSLIRARIINAWN